MFHKRMLSVWAACSRSRDAKICALAVLNAVLPARRLMAYGLLSRCCDHGNEENAMSRHPVSKAARVSRRSVLKGAAALGGAAIGSGVGGFPTVWAQNIKDVVLRHAGAPVTAIPRIAEQATKDLGFTVQMQASEPADLLNRFLSQSSAIDCADVNFVYMRYLVGRDVLQAIPLAKAKHWTRRCRCSPRVSTPRGARRRSRASRQRCSSMPPDRMARR